jgi:hypothetical protein
LNLIPSNKLNGVFIYFEGAFAKNGGGVQICTREYFETLQAAGFNLKALEVKNDRRILNRVRRKLRPRPYRYLFNSEKVINDLKDRIPETFTHIFLNQSILRPLAKLIREHLDRDFCITILSHGLPSVDYLHELRISLDSSFSNHNSPRMTKLASLLIEESWQSQYIDYVFCLSTLEVEIERWLGAKSATYLPRIISASSLTWKPRYSRVGYVGTLDHPPNEEGLVLFLEALEKHTSEKIHLRLIGSPKAKGIAIANRFSFVEYLGRLPDDELREEASTWNCFVHPLFCNAMGCSTKLGIAIGWEIPIATTTMGCRGYAWHSGKMPIADTPETLAQLVLSFMDKNASQQIRKEISKIKYSSPKTFEIATLIRTALTLSDQRPCKENSNSKSKIGL